MCAIMCSIGQHSTLHHDVKKYLSLSRHWNEWEGWIFWMQCWPQEVNLFILSIANHIINVQCSFDSVQSDACMSIQWWVDEMGVNLAIIGWPSINYLICTYAVFRYVSIITRIVSSVVSLWQTFLHSAAKKGLASPHSIPAWEKNVLWFCLHFFKPITIALGWSNGASAK